MATVADVCRWLEGFAPLSLAESWDNVGLLLGDRHAQVERIMTCLTVTSATADEAIAEGANLIVSHHPILFRPTQKLVADRADTGIVWKLARAGVAVYSPHTAFDNCEDGINALLARKFGLLDVTWLRSGKALERFKIIVFAPEADHPAILNAAFAAGAGRIGAYEQCSFSAAGEGTFFGDESTNPSVGQAGRREAVAERRIEIVCDAAIRERVLAAIRKAHSYEEPAIDVYALSGEPAAPGIGRIGALPAPTSLDGFAQAVRLALKCGPMGIVGDRGRKIARVATCCGAGDDFLPDAIRAGADVLVTGEARFHRALEAQDHGIGLILAGHHATERPGVEHLATRLASKFPAVTIRASRNERDPIESW